MSQRAHLSFLHSGDIGDIIYSLPTIKALGGGVLYLNTMEELKIKPKPRFNQSGVSAIIKLLQNQHYIAGVELYNGEPIVYNLDIFRLNQDLSFTNLAELHLKSFGLPTSHVVEPWLTAEKINLPYKILINNTERYQNPTVDWRRIIQQVRDAATEFAFVGLPNEHANFQSLISEEIPYYPTSDLWELACAINSCDYFIGNQSSPMAIAIALGKEILQVVCPDCPNCVFDRGNIQYLK